MDRRSVFCDRHSAWLYYCQSKLISSREVCSIPLRWIYLLRFQIRLLNLQAEGHRFEPCHVHQLSFTRGDFVRRVVRGDSVRLHFRF